MYVVYECGCNICYGPYMTIEDARKKLKEVFRNKMKRENDYYYKHNGSELEFEVKIIEVIK